MRSSGLLRSTAVLLAVAGCSGPAGSTADGSARTTAGAGVAQAVVQAPAGAVRVVPVTASGPPGRASWAAWPQALHDARHSGASTVAGPQHGTVAWRRHLGTGALPTGPVVGARGAAYLVDADGALHALDLRDGHDLWTAVTGRPVTGDLSVSPLVLPDGDVVAGSGEGLAAWSPEGRRLWSVPVPGSPTSPVTTDGRRIWVGTTAGHVAAVDVRGASASLAWDLDTGTGSSYGSVVTDGAGRVYTTSSTGLVAVDDLGDHGRTAWTADPHDGVVEVSAGLSADGVVLLGTNGQHEWAYDRTGHRLWSAPRHITYSSPSVTDDGLAYVGEHDDQVHVFDVHTGAQVGLYPSTVGHPSGKTRVWTSVVVDARHDLYFGTRTHHLVGVRPDGTRLLTVDLGSSTSSYPALTGDGGLLVATDGGDVVLVGRGTARTP